VGAFCQREVVVVEEDGPECGFSSAPGVYAIGCETQSNVTGIQEVSMAKTVTVNGSLLLEKSKVMSAIEHISHSTVLLSLCFRMPLAAVVHSLVELPVEEKCDKLRDQRNVLVGLHWLSISTIAWFLAVWARPQLCMWPRKCDAGLDAAIVAFHKKLG
jgi:hypothetical protein